MKSIMQPAAVKALLVILRTKDPSLTIAQAANLAGDIISDLDRVGLVITMPHLIDVATPPDRIYTPKTETAQRVPGDRWDQLLADAHSKEETFERDRGHTPWRTPELA